MPINIPDTFINAGTGIVNGGNADQTTKVTGRLGVVATRSNDIVTLSQSNAISRVFFRTGSNPFGYQGSYFHKFNYGGESGDVVTGQVAFFNATAGQWERTGSNSFNATLLLGFVIDEDDTTLVLKRGVCETDQDFSSVPIGSALYLGASGIVTSTKPTTPNHYVRLIGWSLDQDSSNGKMFFSPDVNFQTVA